MDRQGLMMPNNVKVSLFAVRTGSCVWYRTCIVRTTCTYSLLCVSYQGNWCILCLRCIWTSQFLLRWGRSQHAGKLADPLGTVAPMIVRYNVHSLEFCRALDSAPSLHSTVLMEVRATTYQYHTTVVVAAVLSTPCCVIATSTSVVGSSQNVGGTQCRANLRAACSAPTE